MNFFGMKVFRFCFTAIVIAGFLANPLSLSAQSDNIPLNKRVLMHEEVLDDPYMPLPADERQTSAPHVYHSRYFFTTQVNVDGSGHNIVGDAANEPSITVDPTNPNRMVIGWRQFDNVNSNFRQAGYAYTTDGGDTWTFPGSINPGVFRSDPVLDVDTEGNFYYNSLSNNGSTYYCHVFKTSGNVIDWDEGTFAQGGDKQWMRIDRSGSAGNNHIYSYWTTYYSFCNPGAFTRSTDAGATYEDCFLTSGDPMWGTLATGPEGELYIVGVSGFFGDVQVNKSIDAKDPSSDVTWDITTEVNMDGTLTGWAPVNPGGLMGQAWIDVDKSDGSGRGNVYVLASVERYSTSDPADVMFARSTDGGLSWDDPVKINDDNINSNYQWFGTMSVAPNGRIDAVWLDTRDATTSDPYLSSLYYSYSLDQGETWSENRRLSDSFDPHLGWPNQEKIGDYYDMVSDNEYAHLAWAHTFNGEQDVNYARIRPLYANIEDIPLANLSLGLKCYPNPVENQSTIKYKLHQAGNVSLVITDISGRIVDQLVNTFQQEGSYEFEFNAGKLGSGIYFCILETETKLEKVKISVLR